MARCDCEYKARWWFSSGRLDGFGFELIVTPRPFSFVIGFVRWWIAIEYY